MGEDEGPELLTDAQRDSDNIVVVTPSQKSASTRERVDCVLYIRRRSGG